MKKLFLALLLAGLPQPTLAAPQMVTVKVNGLVCDFCARSIEAMMKKRTDVSSVHVDLGKGEVHLGLKDGAQLTDPELTRLITDSGYKVTGIERMDRP